MFLFELLDLSHFTLSYIWLLLLKGVFSHKYKNVCKDKQSRHFDLKWSNAECITTLSLSLIIGSCTFNVVQLFYSSLFGSPEFYHKAFFVLCYLLSAVALLTSYLMRYCIFSLIKKLLSGLGWHSFHVALKSESGNVEFYSTDSLDRVRYRGKKHFTDRTFDLQLKQERAVCQIEYFTFSYVHSLSHTRF